MTEKFRPFPKIPRWSREVIISEKIDGTNASIHIDEEGNFRTASRNRWITVDDDNFGFSQWAHLHKEELMKLGVGSHFGEWWGSKIQRGYGLTDGERRWSLFNVIRWCRYGETPEQIPCADPRIVKFQEELPQCVDLVPILWKGLFDYLDLEAIMSKLWQEGSRAAPGYMRPEGVVIFHTGGNTMFKKTFEGDKK